MSGRSIDKRWIILFVVVILLANAPAIPWWLMMLLLLGGGGYLLDRGWKVWNHSSPRVGRKKVVYWRQQRIELEEPAGGKLNLPPWRDITPALIYLLLGIALVLGGISILTNHL